MRGTRFAPLNVLGGNATSKRFVQPYAGKHAHPPRWNISQALETPPMLALAPEVVRHPLAIRPRFAPRPLADRTPGLAAAGGLAQQLGQLGDVDGDAPRIVARH
jgi:hypothetical protein